MGDAGVGPVEEPVPAAALGHVREVQVPVHQRGRNGRVGELAAHRHQPGRGGPQLGRLVGRQPGRVVDPGEPAGVADRRQPPLRLGGEPVQAAVQAARGEQPVDLGGRPDLQPGEVRSTSSRTPTGASQLSSAPKSASAIQRRSVSTARGRARGRGTARPAPG